jgi:hypothetical protein
VSNIKEVDFSQKPDVSLITTLRNMLALAERGQLVKLVAIYQASDKNVIVRNASLNDSLVMSSLLKEQILREFFDGDQA